MNTVIQTRIDDKSKTKAEAIFRQMGMSLNDGIRIFICQVINENALPFKRSAQKVFSDDTLQALNRAENYISQKDKTGFKSFANIEELAADIEGKD